MGKQKSGANIIVSGVTLNNVWPERVCTNCRKKFIVKNISDWVYKRGERTLFCSWHCIREFEKMNGEARKQWAHNRTLKEKIFQLMDEGLKRQEIVRRLGCSSASVQYWEDRITEADR